MDGMGMRAHYSRRSALLLRDRGDGNGLVIKIHRHVGQTMSLVMDEFG